MIFKNLCIGCAGVLFVLTSFIPPAPNQSPVADAGEDLIIKLPTNTVILDGTGSTDDVGIAKYRWRLKSGDDSLLDLRVSIILFVFNYLLPVLRPPAHMQKYFRTFRA